MNHVMRKKKAASCKEKDRKKRDERRGRQNPILAVGAEVLWRQPTRSGGRHRDPLLG